MSSYVTTAMTAHFGDRESCGHTDHDPYCTTCLAWAEYDAIATNARAAGLREAVAVIRASSTIDRDGTVTTGTADLEIILAHAAEVEEGKKGNLVQWLF